MKHKGQSVFYHNWKHKEESENMTHQGPRYFWQTFNVLEITLSQVFDNYMLYSHLPPPQLINKFDTSTWTL